MTYKASTESRIDYYRKEAIEHLENNEIYYAKIAITKAVEISDQAIERIQRT